MKVNGVLIGWDVFSEICRDHGITDLDEVYDVMDVFENNDASFVDKAIEKYQDKKAVDKAEENACLG